MAHRGIHCPFLNRSDDRCVENFHLANLSHALHHCFGNYNACPVYVELLVARQARRMTVGHGHSAFVQLSVGGIPPAAEAANPAAA